MAIFISLREPGGQETLDEVITAQPAVVAVASSVMAVPLVFWKRYVPDESVTTS
jgi:hypothetical protein